MTGAFQIRRSINAADRPDAVRFEIEHVSCERRRVFVVVDLSDSTRGITTQLDSLGYLWRLLPAQWKVSLRALSPSLQLPGGDVTTSAGDVGKTFEKLSSLSPTTSKELQKHAARGSFLGPTLKAIDAKRAEEATGAEDHALPAIVFVITDGEMLDLGPVHPRADVQVIGVVLHTASNRIARWNAVVPGSQCFRVSDTALTEHIRGIAYPDARECTITVAFAPDELPEVYQWDFASGGKYDLDVPSCNLSAESVIECRTQNGACCKWPIHSLLKGETDEILSAFAHAGPATVASGAFHEIQDESLIHALCEHAIVTQDDERSWDADVVRLLANHLATSSRELQTGSARPQALLAVFCRQKTGDLGDTRKDESTEASRLLLGLLYTDRSHSIYIPRGTAPPSDPGFSAKEDVHIIWDKDQRRFAVLAGETRRELLPKECERLDYFFDGLGNECTAFYSGRIDWPA